MADYVACLFSAGRWRRWRCRCGRNGEDEGGECCHGESSFLVFRSHTRMRENLGDCTTAVSCLGRWIATLNLFLCDAPVGGREGQAEGASCGSQTGAPEASNTDRSPFAQRRGSSEDAPVQDHRPPRREGQAAGVEFSCQEQIHP